METKPHEVYQPPMFNTAAYVNDPRAGLERYDSPVHAVDDLFDNLPFHVAGRILEPCSGHGMITNPLRDRGYEVVTNDIDSGIDADMHYDACDPRAPFSDCAWAITNPPFSLAQRILENLLPRVKCGCLFLLRLTFSEPTIERDKFFQRWPPNGSIVTQRYSFYNDGVDSTTTAWLFWLNRAVPRWKGAEMYQAFHKDEQFFRIAKRRG